MKTKSEVVKTTNPNTVAGRFRIACAALLLLLSASAVKATYTYGNFICTDNYTDNGIEVYIWDYTGIDSVVVIPDTINGSPVTHLESYSFQECTGMTSVSIPGSVYSIGYQTFALCTGLTGVVIPNSVISISDQAFMDCNNLTSVTIGNGVTYIGDDAFQECTSLTSVTIPKNVTDLGEGAFYYCTSLTSVTIGNGITEIQDSTFKYCTSLTSVTIPDSVTSIGFWAFYGCTNLTSVTIGNGVTSIMGDAFGFCTSLASVAIGNSVTSMDMDEAFEGCNSLTAITVGTMNPVYSSVDGVLFNKNQTTLIRYPWGKAGSYTLPDSVTSIEDYAFEGCTKLTSVTIGNGVTSIGTHAFYDCNDLTGVYFKGDAPDYGHVFSDDSKATVYYLSGTTGWSSYFDGRPTALWTYVETSPLSITKCTIAAGSGTKGDSISFSGTMSPTADDFDNANADSDANFIKITISPEDTNYSKTVTFPVNSETWKKSKFSYSGTENGVKKSFSYVVKTGKFSLSASNIDLTGLECPLTIDINVGDFAETATVDETIVNGTKPIPINLMMGVKNSLRVDKSKFTKKSGVITQVAISGGFSDANVNDTNLLTNQLDITIDSNTFTIPTGKFKNTNGKFTCSKVNTINSSGVAAATFDFNKGTWTLTIKNTSFTADSGTADFKLEFGDFNEGAEISLP